jgi:hypothetical protein
MFARPQQQQQGNDWLNDGYMAPAKTREEAEAMLREVCVFVTVFRIELRCNHTDVLVSLHASHLFLPSGWSGGWFVFDSQT